MEAERKERDSHTIGSWTRHRTPRQDYRVNSGVSRPVALITGVGRRQGIGAAIVKALAEDGWDIGFTYWKPYDSRMPWGEDTEGPAAVAECVTAAGGASFAVEADLGLQDSPAEIFDAVENRLGVVSALVVAHCESVNSSTLDTTPESFDKHYAVNVRGTWLLIREFGRRFVAGSVPGRIVTLTSDHTVGNLPYGSTKAAADRVTLAAAFDLAGVGITANAINPGAIDTGWMTEQHRDHARHQTPLQRMAEPLDAANLVRFLCSAEGGWITGQLLYSNGGFKSSIL
jgi:3-oxoacyl-[acyl-carrier protein] reductase